MQLKAYAVNWSCVVAVNGEGRLEGMIAENDVGSLFITSSPWPSDSCVGYLEVALAYEAIKWSLSPSTRSTADLIMSALINEEQIFPMDLGDIVDRDLVAGALSPQRVGELAGAFGSLRLDELGRAFDQHLPARLRASLQICRPGESPTEFTDYIVQWRALLEFARDRQAGVLFKLG